MKITIEDCKGLKPLYDKPVGRRAIVLDVLDDGEMVMVEMPKGDRDMLVPLYEISSEAFHAMGDVMRVARRGKFKTVVIVFSSYLKKIGIIAIK